MNQKRTSPPVGGRVRALRRRGSNLGRVVPSTRVVASSAASVSRRYGVAVRSESIWVDGEGWVRWSEIEAEVARAHHAWRARKALEGWRFAGQAEHLQAGIDEALGRHRMTSPNTRISQSYDRSDKAN